MGDNRKHPGHDGDCSEYCSEECLGCAYENNIKPKLSNVWVVDRSKLKKVEGED